MSYLRSIVFAVLFMCMGSKSAFSGQEGMGGLNVNPPREVQAEGIIITWSESNDELRGFSQKLGDWEVLKIDPQKLNPKQEITPVVASNIAAVRFGDSIAAFSGEKGWWDVVELSKDSTAVPVVSPSLAVFEDNGHLYTFSSNKGRWSSPTDPELQSLTEHVDLQGHPNAVKAVVFAEVAFEKWLETLPKYKARGIRAQFSGSGAVYLHVDRRSCLAEATVAVEKALTRWQTVDGEHALKRPTSSGQSEISSVKEIESSIASLRNKMLHLDNSLRDVSASPRVQESSASQTSAELRKLVEQSFDLRQQMQELEAQRLRLKLQQVENNLAVRAKSRDAMVTRRMEELRRPDIGAKAPLQKLENPSTSRSSSPSAESIAPSIADVRIENSNSKTQWPQPGEIARQLRSFRESAISDMEAMRDPTMSVETWSQPLEKLIADGLLNPGTGDDAQRDGLVGAKERKSQLQKHLNDVRRDWNYAWSAYQSQLELFRLDLSDRKEEESIAALEFNQKTDANRESLNAYSPDEIRVSEIMLERSRRAVQRAEQMLKLYADIEANEPELNPSTLKGLDEIAASKEPTASVPVEASQNLPQQVISMAEQLRKLRDAAVKIREERQPHENLITQYSRPLEQLKAEGAVTADTTEDFLKTQIARSKPEFDRLTTSFENSARAWKQAWNAYRSQSKLFELNVREAEAASVSAKQTFDHVQAKFRQGLVGAQEMQNTEASLNAAVLQLEKAEETLRMWQDVEKNNPKVNPDWKPESDSTTAEPTQK